MMKYSKTILFKSNKFFVLIASILIFIACNDLFEFSPYEANVRVENTNTTVKNLLLLKDIHVESDDFKFAVISDSHFFYTHLSDVIEDINKKGDISFVIFGGDMAHQGLLKEFELFFNIAQKLDKPYLTVIGNHDYKLNGGVIYKEMFGDYNYSFEFSHNKFVFFDDVVWESNKKPDFDWLSIQLSSNALYNHVFVIAHIPPFAEQLDSDMEQKYKSLLQENNVRLSISGHLHSYSYAKVYGDDVNYLIVPSLKEPAYCIIHVDKDSFDVELIKL